MAQRKQELDLNVADCAAKRIRMNNFLKEPEKHNRPLAEFDPLIWQAVIHHATVNADCTITFVFRDGTEKTVPIKNGVRKYARKEIAGTEDIVAGNKERIIG